MRTLFTIDPVLPRKRAAGLAALVLLVLGCGEKSPDLFGVVPELNGVGGRTGNGRGGAAPVGRGGVAGRGGVGGSVPDAGWLPDGGGVAGTISIREDAGPADAGDAVDACQALDCNDDNECTLDRCDAGACVHTPLALGALCGNTTAGECVNPDSCNGNGQCVPNPVPVGTACGGEAECRQPGQCNAAAACVAPDEPNGRACSGGSCALGQCIAGQPVGCPFEVVTSVPFQTDWSSVGRPDLYDGSCDDSGTADYAFVFTAPATATFRFGATSSDDSVLTLAEGSCGGPSARQIACNDDIQLNVNLNSRLDVALTLGQTVTGYVNELDSVRGGNGTLTITQR